MCGAQTAQRAAGGGLVAALGFAICLSALTGASAQSNGDGADVAVVEPEALDALNRMGAYLRSLTSFAVVADSTRDDIAETGETIEYASRVTMKARLPDRLRVDVSSDRNERQFFYDGDRVVIYAPAVGAYAGFAAGATIREALETASADYALELPLADLFVWGTPEDDKGLLTDAFSVGPSRIGGEDCEHFVFRQEGIDWQLWVREGDAPLPCRLVITSTDEEARPRYSATLDWDLEAGIADSDFVFTPTDGTYEIAIEPAAGEDVQ